MGHYLESFTIGATISIRALLLKDQQSLGSGERAVLVSVRGWKLHVCNSMLQVPGDGQHFTFCNVLVSQIAGHDVLLDVLPTSHVLGHVDTALPHHAIELCCGLGGISSGVQHAGISVLGGVDISALAVEIFNMNHDCQALQGDIANMSVLAQLFHNIGFRSVGLLMGFPCPPFSSMGDQRGFHDPRAKTFIHGLDAAYLFRSAWVLLECTPLVEQFEGTRQHLDAFSAVMGFKWTSQVLHLDFAWPVRRSRWWCLLTPDHVAQHLCLTDLPKAPGLQSIDAILRCWPTWPKDAGADLLWTPEEEEFHSNFASISDLVLNCAGKCPTLLHSLGHLDRACPCGCRSHPLSCRRLKEHGISTVAVQCTHTDNLRHLHPLEAGFFNTLSPAFRFNALRDMLPLIGQVAAPMQAHWAATHLLRALQIEAGLAVTELTDPALCHANLQHHLLSLAFHLWPTSKNNVPRSVAFRFPGGCKIVFEVAAGLRLENLLDAQKTLGGWEGNFEIKLDGLPVPPAAILQPACYEVCCVPPLASSSFCLTLNGRAWTGPLVAGITIRSLLNVLGFHPRHGLALLIDAQPVDLDQRFFSSFRGTLVPAAFVGAGLSPVVGLSNFQIDAEAARMLRLAGPAPGLKVLTALDLSTLLLLSESDARVLLSSLLDSADTDVFGIFCSHGHWAAVSFDRVTRLATYYDGYPGFSYDASFIINLLADHWQLSSYAVQTSSLLSQTHGSHCGVIALVNLGQYLGLWTSFMESDALEWFRALMTPAFVGMGQVEYNKAHGLLVAELPKHGVPSNEAAARAAAALKKLGVQPILKAFSAKSPWQALKSLGNSQDRPFQWIQHTELEQHVNKRALDRKAPMPKIKKTSDKKARPVSLVPSQIVVPDGTFEDAEGEALSAINLDDISSSARGLVIVSQEDAHRFLLDNKVISMDCLALLTLVVLDVPPDTKLDCVELTWPAILADTKEPLLIRGTCIQLGDVRAAPCTGPDMNVSIDTDLLRLFVYRDQWPLDWKRLTDGPLKMLISHFPCLQFCGQSCAASVGCLKFHPAVEEQDIRMVVLDAFAWRWHDGTGRPTPALKAAAFSLLVRVPKSGSAALLACSGTDGFYTELRDDANKASHPSFSVVWLSDDFEAAKHKLRSLEGALHLVRFHGKYGLRCQRKDAKVLHELVFPDRRFVDCGTSLQFEMGPWPWGTSKDAIIACLESLEWKAKPLRAVTGGRAGRFWLIGSSEDPPQLAVPYAQQFLTITKVKDIPAVKPVPNVVASLRTLNRLATPAAASSTVDLLQQHDPWKGQQLRAAPSASTTTPATAARLTELETRLERKLTEQLQEQLQTVHEDSTEDDGRLRKLEVSVQELTAQQTNFTKWCTDAADKISNISQTVQAQDGRMTQIETQVQGNTQATENLGSQLLTWQSAFKSDWQDAMNRQTASLEALIEKRSRREWLSRQPRSLRWVCHWLFMWILLGFVRVGEASNPGPPTSFVVGVANPSGIGGKAQSFLELPAGIWNVSETQATDVGARRFANELRACQQPLRHLNFAHGAPAPLRSGSTYAGTWTGVAQISDFSLRPVMLPWRGAEYRSGRAMVSSFAVGPNHVLGATLYAPPQGPTYPDAKRLTGELLATLTEEIVLGHTGPRYIAGDMNCSTTDQEAFSQWRALGWLECQDLHMIRHGTAPLPTCKQATRPDHLWLSPELQRWFTHVFVRDDIFADHAVVESWFVAPAFVQWHHSWFQPSLLPWSSLDAHALEFPSQEAFSWNLADMTQSFRDWSSLAESELIQALEQHVVVSNTCVGRGQTTDIVRKHASLLPISPGRAGDVAPRSSLLGRLVHQWFRQLRRIQAYLRRVRSVSHAPALAVDLITTWRAVLRAPGFTPSFQQWWLARSVRLHGSPVDFPALPPGPGVAYKLFLDFEANYRSLERWHLAQRTKIIKAKYFHHNKLLYQQLRPLKASTVTHFEHSQSATVTAVTDGLSLTLDSPLVHSESSTWTLEGAPVCVATAVDSQVTLDATTDLIPVPGQSVKCSSFKTAFDDLELDLHALWEPIWQRHLGLADSHWDRIVAFGKAYLPPGRPHSSTWTASRVEHAVKGYKRKVTRGPDSWDRLDLMALSSSRHSDLANLLSAIEHGAAWPRQLVTGFVCPIAKCDTPTLPTHFRPIVLISLFYRIWASASAKAFLPDFCRRLPSHIFGYIPGRSASDLWTFLQLALDVSHASGQVLSGYCADLVKCFNRLPRFPLLQLLLHFGLAPETVCAWTSALAQLERRFRILTDVGPARLSTTGFPEGDPLSCLAMLAFNYVFDAYITAFAPGCIPLSYVDNIQLVSALAADLQPGILVLQTFMQAWDLSLDAQKSYAWSTNALNRAHLKAFGHCVQLNCRDLGSQMHYARKPSRGVLKQRLASVAPLWQLLRNSLALPWFRCLAIRVAIWPKVLHSCESAWISEACLDQLRSRCMYALRWNRAGASPLVRWALMQPIGHDPSFMQVWNVLSSFLKLSLAFEFVQEAWMATLNHHHCRSGILHALEQALNFLGWHLTDDWQLCTSFLQMPWFDVSLDVLKILVAHDWQQVICHRLEGRKDFAGLPTINVDASFNSLHMGDVASSELLATIQDGTFCTANIFAKYDPEKTETCWICGCVDDLKHRCLVCPRFQAVRQRHSGPVQRWHQMPRAFTDHGLIQENPHLVSHWKNLVGWPDQTETFFVAALTGRHYEVFTDGTCLAPTCRPKRLAMWAAYDMTNNRILTCGMVQGLIQTIEVAELTAVVAVLKWLLRDGASACIHSDSSYVVDGLLYVRSHMHVPARWKHQLLWTRVLCLLQQLDAAQWAVHKVVSHGDATCVDDVLTEWWIAGNFQADRLASEVYDTLPLSFRQTYELFCTAHDHQSQLVKEQLLFLLDLAKHSLGPDINGVVDEEELSVAVLRIPSFPNESVLFSQVDPDFDFGNSHLGGFTVQFCKSIYRE